MALASVEVADIIRGVGGETLEFPDLRLSRAQRKVLVDLALCHTAKLGGRIEVCNACGKKRVRYKSCRNRHCPKCQAKRRAQWLDLRVQDVLPVPYFHAVFTVTDEIATLAVHNPKIVYELLFQCTARALKEIAGDPKHLGAKIGFLAVLHTWSEKMLAHSHIHCVIPGGGLNADGTRWVACRTPDFFLPVRVLSRRFRNLLVDALRHAFDAGRLKFSGRLAHLKAPEQFRAWCAKQQKKEWVMHITPPPPRCGPENVLKYLARYINRVAISNHRILSFDGQRVRFRYKDYARGGKQRTLVLDAVHFLRRFLLHVLPKGFTKVRYYGFLANCCRKKKLARCRELIDNAELQDEQNITQDPVTPEVETPAHSDPDDDPLTCPMCGVGTMIVAGKFKPQSTWDYPLATEVRDTS